MTLLESIVENNPELFKFVDILSFNPNISVKFIRKHNKYLWNMSKISFRITYDEFVNNDDLIWNFLNIIHNHRIPIKKIVEKYNLCLDLEDETDLNQEIFEDLTNIDLWDIFTENASVNEVIENPNFPWRYEILYKNKLFDIDYYKKKGIEITMCDLKERAISNIQFLDIINGKIKINDCCGCSIYKIISHIPSLSIQYIIENIDKDWDWETIFVWITFEDFNKFINYFSEILKGKNEYLKTVVSNIKIDYESLSQNINIPFEYIRDNPDKPWDYKRISERVTTDKIIDNPDFPWEWDFISVNPYLSRNFINKYHELINAKLLMHNLFDNDPIFKTFIYKKLLAKKIMNVIINDNDYISMVYNPKRIRSYKTLCELEEMKLDYNWDSNEFNEYLSKMK